MFHSPWGMGSYYAGGLRAGSVLQDHALTGWVLIALALFLIVGSLFRGTQDPNDTSPRIGAIRSAGASPAFLERTPCSKQLGDPLASGKK